MSIALDKKDRAAWLTIDNPPLNVLNLPMLRELKNALDRTEEDRTIQFLVIRGGGERAFSAGVDVKDHTPDKAGEMLQAVHSVIRKLFALPQVTMALVRGACVGGGFELASSCDLVFASEESVFATPEIDVGCFPPVALARFPSLIGYHRAAEMILTGRKWTAQEAWSAGLINRVVTAAELPQAVETTLGELSGKSAAVLRIALKGLREIAVKKLFPALERSEEIYLQELLRTEDVEEGVRAFVEKRKPRWSHR